MSEKTRVRNRVQVDGKSIVVGAETITVYLQDSAGMIMDCAGTTVPTDDTAGYAKGCRFVDTDVADNTSGVYENIGTTALCEFNAVSVIDTNEISDEAITNEKMDAEVVKYTEVTLTAAQIKALAGTNIELVPATEAGAGYAIIPISVAFAFTAGTEVLTESADNLALLYSASTELLEIETTGFIDQATNQNRVQSMAEAVLTPVANTAIDLDNKGDGEIAGNATNDATLLVRTYYRVVPVV